MRLRRRTLLASLGTTAVSAGCIGTRTPGDEERTTTTPGDGQPPHTTPGGDRFADVPCPSFGDADRTVCWHTRDDAAVYLEPSTQWFKPVSGNDAAETVTLTLHNESGGPFTLNPHEWAVKRQTDDGWVHVAPDAAVQPLVVLPPGETYEWVLSRESRPTPHADQTLYPTVDLQNGRHAFVVDGWAGDVTDADPTSPSTTSNGSASTTATSGDAPTVECVALFDVTRIYADTGTA